MLPLGSFYKQNAGETCTSIYYILLKFHKFKIQFIPICFSKAIACCLGTFYKQIWAQTCSISLGYSQVVLSSYPYKLFWASDLASFYKQNSGQTCILIITYYLNILTFNLYFPYMFFICPTIDAFYKQIRPETCRFIHW
jgi:hypothetical protein